MSPKTILIVDDDRNVRQSMALVLRRADYHVDTAGSAADALANLDASQYDLTIVDMMMPDDGSIFLPRLLAAYPCLSILVLTAQINPETPLETIHEGKHARLVKPVTPESLLERVKWILKDSPCSSGGESYQQLPKKLLL